MEKLKEKLGEKNFRILCTGVIGLVALFLLLSGDIATALGLFILWGVVSLMRSCIQAKLLGDQLGLPPLVTLMAIYVGWCAAGVWGMVLFPMLALVLKQMDLPRRIRRRSYGG